MKRTFIMILALTLMLTLSQIANAAIRSSEPIRPIPPLIDEYDQSKVDLGKKLFFEPRLSKSGFISCNSCHNLSRGGVDNLPTSIGHKWQLGPINSPTVLNAKYNIAQFWDGRAKDLRAQAGGPIANPGEMASTHEVAIKVLESIPEYKYSFKKIYGEGPIKIENVTDAIATFEETLTTPDSPFDQWLMGFDQAISKDARKGYELFKKKGCTGCHNGRGVGGRSYQKFGVAKPYEKDTETLGRFNVTGVESDKYVFKVPLLRNIELTAPYFHDGSTWDLREAVRIMGEYQLGIKLSEKEIDRITAFLKTLTGAQPIIAYPILPPSTIDTPLPEL